MVRGALPIAMLISTAVVGCAADPQFAVRSVAAAPAEGGDKLAYAKASLALGNLGLALQYFRQALREEPSSINALSGIALCYDAMGRDDLSRRYFQEALALAPADTHLLRSFAGMLERQGATAEAAAVIAEIALRTRAPAVQWVIKPMVRPSIVGASVTTSADQPPRLVDRQPSQLPIPKARLERLSLGEIALVTTGAALWKNASPNHAASVPANGHALRSQTPPVRLLNAARRQGLAARHAERLKSDGWDRLEVGNASRVRRASLILYPAARVSEARRLAVHLEIGAMHVARRSDILVLLGRDVS